MSEQPDWQAIRAESQQRDQVAHDEVESFVGLSAAAATARAEALGLSLRIVTAGSITSSEYRFGRITATVTNGTVSGATVG